MSDNPRFPLHDESTAPQAARDILAKAKQNLGLVPNLEKVMAQAPPLLEAYVRTWDLFDQTTLTPIERQVVYQTANYENECRYCVPWHSLLAKKAGLGESDVQALREGTPLSDAKLEALRRFTRAVLLDRGHVSESEFALFFAAGYDARHALEVVLGLAVKTMSNFTNALADTPLDKPVRGQAWQRPRRGGRASE